VEVETLGTAVALALTSDGPDPVTSPELVLSYFAPGVSIGRRGP
jgi:hypothetical protein